MRISIFKQTLDRVGCNVLNSMGFRVAALNIFRADGFFEAVWGEGDAECCAALLGTHVPLNDWSRIAPRASESATSGTGLTFKGEPRLCMS